MTKRADVPEVSVVMGIFNAVQTAPATILSILGQQDVALEFIVVDDGSTDGTSELLDRLAASDARLRVVHQPNAGLTASLVRGCGLASAPFIARQDAGDISLPGRLRRQLDAFAPEPRLAFVSCATEYVDREGAFLFRQAGNGCAREPIEAIDLAARHGMRDGPSHHGSVMFRRDAYLAAGGYRREFHFGQDWDLWYRLAQHGLFQMLDQTLYRASIAPGDISATRKPQQEKLAALSLRALHERAAGRSDGPVLTEAARIRPVRGVGDTGASHAAAHACYFLGECLRRNGDTTRASDYFRQAIRSRPFFAKAWVRLAQARLRQLAGGH
jgi:GT2 family glycosyltransferase